MGLRILGIHGVWNYRPGLDADTAARAIATDWCGSLPGREPADIRVAYYADLLRASVPQGPDDLDALPLEVEQMILDWAAGLGAVPVSTAAQGPGTVPVRWLVDRVATVCALRPALAAGLRGFVGRFFREVAAYLHEPDGTMRQAVRARVADALERHRPDVVLAHSLGSVVAWETLFANPELKVPLLITMGSPLGMPAVVYERLQPSQPNDKGQRPPNVGRWVNIADTGDIIAVPRPFTRRFTPDENHEQHIHLVDFHLAGNYLRAASKFLDPGKS